MTTNPGINNENMLNSILASFFERDIRKLIDEINLFVSAENLWLTHGSVKNSAGNLVLHIIGGTHHLIGKVLANSDYVRDRDQEFTKKGIERSLLVAQLEELIPLIADVVNKIDLEADYPIFFDNAKRSNAYVLTQLLLHLNYHLGQVNYIRRVLE
jgi:hypothetical protein